MYHLSAQLARIFLGATCFAGYPFPVESEVRYKEITKFSEVTNDQVVAVYDREGVWRKSKRGRIVKEAADTPWDDMVSQVKLNPFSDLFSHVCRLERRT